MSPFHACATASTCLLSPARTCHPLTYSKLTTTCIHIPDQEIERSIVRGCYLDTTQEVVQAQEGDYYEELVDNPYSTTYLDENPETSRVRDLIKKTVKEFSK